MQSSPYSMNDQATKVNIYGPVLWNVYAMILHKYPEAEVYMIDDHIYVNHDEKVDISEFVSVPHMGGGKYILQGHSLKVRVSPVLHSLGMLKQELEKERTPLESTKTKLVQVLTMIDNLQVPIDGFLHLLKILEQVHIDSRLLHYHSNKYKFYGYIKYGNYSPTPEIASLAETVNQLIKSKFEQQGFEEALLDKVKTYNDKITQYDLAYSSVTLYHAPRILKGIAESIPGWT
jgi:hypothetical protein